MIVFFFETPELGWGEVVHAHAFGQVHSQHTDLIFVGTALVRCMRVADKGLARHHVPGRPKLGATVGRDAFKRDATAIEAPFHQLRCQLGLNPSEQAQLHI